MTDGITIRRAHAGDTDAVHGIETLCFSDPWSRQSFYNEFTENPGAFYVLAEAEGRAAGYAGLWMIGDEGHITNVAVRPECRGRGIGSALLDALIGQTRENGIRHWTLEVRTGNAAARALYEKHGFTAEGIRKKYYKKEKEDALIMWRHEDI